MKIGLVCPYNMWGNGGVQECVLSVADELERRGYDVRIITPMPRGYRGHIPKRILTAGMSANVRAFYNTQTQFSASIDIDAIKRMLDAEKFDVLHFHEPWVPIVSRQVLTRSKSANVTTSHAKIPDRLTSKAITNVFSSYTKGLLKYIHAYSAVSDPAAEYIKNFTSDKIEIIPNGIDLKKYQRSPKKPTKQKTILYIGRLEKRKGVIYLLEAFKELSRHHPEVHLVIAGDGELREKFEQWVKEHRVPRVKFLGFVSERRKHTLLNNADLFCSPALYGESFGIVLLEAMAMGLVTVAGNNPGYTSVMRDKGRVSLVDPQNTAEFVKKLEMFLYDSKKRKDWQDWAAEYVKQFDYSNIVDQYERLYKRGLKNAKR